MKKGWVLLLLISLGLNVGLGVRVVRQGQEGALPGRGIDGTERLVGQRWERPAPSDSTAWRQFMGRRVEHLARRLELRPEQIVAFKAAQQMTGRPMRRKRREMSLTRTRLQELMATADVDRPAVRHTMARMAQMRAEMDSLTAETMLGELEILDSDQRAKYLDFLPDGAGRHRGRSRRGQTR